MPRLSRKLRICKCAGTLGCVLIVAAFLCSGTWTLRERRSIGRTVYVVQLRDALIWLGRYPLGDRTGLGWSLSREPSFRWPRFDLAWIPPGTAKASHGSDVVLLPLWLPFLILFIPTLLLWRRDHRKPRSGFCRGCDYDLTGSTTGRCPECGASCRPAMDGAPPHAG